MNLQSGETVNIDCDLPIFAIYTYPEQDKILLAVEDYYTYYLYDTKTNEVDIDNPIDVRKENLEHETSGQ